MACRYAPCLRISLVAAEFSPAGGADGTPAFQAVTGCVDGATEGRQPPPAGNPPPAAETFVIESTQGSNGRGGEQWGWAVTFSATATGQLTEACVNYDNWQNNIDGLRIRVSLHDYLGPNGPNDVPMIAGPLEMKPVCNTGFSCCDNPNALNP